MKSYYLHLIRHGSTQANVLGQYVGKTDLPLTTDGINEITILREEAIYPKVSIVYASPMKRCLQTAEIIYPGKEIVVINNLREYDFGRFECKTAYELEMDPAYIEWTSGRAAPPGGEDTKGFTERLLAGFMDMVKNLSVSGETEAAAVVHGGVIMTLLAASGLPKRPMIEWACGNGRGYTVKITPSLFARNGVFEIVEELPPFGARVINGEQKKLFGQV